MKLFRSLLSLAVALAMVLTMGTLAVAEEPTQAEATAEPEWNEITDAPTAEPEWEEVTDAPTEEPAPAYYTLGDKVDDFTAVLTDGTEVTLSELLKTKKVVMLNFWATWCSPCQMEFPFMQEAYDLYKDDVAIIALSCDSEDTAEVITQYKADNKLTTLPMGPVADIAEAFNYNSIPTTVIIDRFGVVCFQESGSMPSTASFTALFDYFLEDDYTESKILYEAPSPKPTVENPSSEALSAAMNAEGSTLVFTCDTEDKYAWPFLPQENGGVAPSNKGVDMTTAVMKTSVTAKAGDALVFDYTVSSEYLCDMFQVYVNDELVTFLSGEKTGAYAYAFPADGDYTVSFQYKKDPGSAVGADQAVISQARVLSGDEATAAVAAVEAATPKQVKTLEGSEFKLEFVDAKEIMITDLQGAYAKAMGGAPEYVAGSDTVRVRVLLGKDLDANSVCLYSDVDGVPIDLTACETDDKGYLVDLPILGVEDGAYSNVYVTFIDDYFGEQPTEIMVVVYKNEENVNYWVKQVLPQNDINALWAYKDGSLPTTQEIAQAPTELPEGYGAYSITVVDEAGAPVAGAMVQVCDAETCQVLPTDDNGQLVFQQPAYAYEIHILTLPEGYTIEEGKESAVMPQEGGELTFTVKKAE